MTRDDGPGGGGDGVSGDGLIYPEAFWGKSRDLDTEAIRTSAAALKTLGASVAEKTGDISAVWNELPGVYESPEASRVYTLMGPAVATADGIEDDFTRGAKLLDTFAGELDAIKPKLADLEVRANAFRAKALAGIVVKADPLQRGIGDQTGRGSAWEEQTTQTVYWREDTATVAENKALLSEYYNIVEQITMSANSCARGIKAIAGTLICTPGQGSGMTGVITADQLEAAGSLPFGYPAEEDRSCGESVADGIWDFGEGIVVGAGMLTVGYNPETGGFWDGSAYGQAWGGLGNLAGSLVVMIPAGIVAIPMMAAGVDNGFTQWTEDRADVIVGAGGSLVGWDHQAWRDGGDGWHAWKEDGVATATTSVLNIGTFFIPAAGAVGAGAKTGSVTARLGSAASTAAEFVVPGGSWLLKGGAGVVRAGEAAVTVARGGTAGVLDAARLGKSGVLTSLDNVTAGAAFTPGRPKVTDQLFNTNVTKPATPRIEAPGGTRLGNPTGRLGDMGAVTKPAPTGNLPAPRHTGSHFEAPATPGARGAGVPEPAHATGTGHPPTPGTSHTGEVTGGTGGRGSGVPEVEPRPQAAHGADAGGGTPSRPEPGVYDAIPDTIDSPLFDPDKAHIREADLNRAFGENPYTRADHTLPDAAATPAPERVPALVGATEHAAGRADLTGPGHVTNSIDTPPRTTGHPDTGGRIDNSGTSTHTRPGGDGTGQHVDGGGAGRGSGGSGSQLDGSSGHVDGGGHGPGGNDPGIGSHSPGGDADGSAPEGSHGSTGRAPDAITSLDPGVTPGGGKGWPDPARDYPRPQVDQVIKVEGRDVPGPRTAFTSSRFAQRGLEPNTLYHVEGRGDFYTDATGEITYVEATYGGKQLNWDLHHPKANTTYIVHPAVTHPSPGASYAHVFITDAEGRTVLTHTDRLARGEGVRSESVQSRVGSEGGPGYDGGHDFGAGFGAGGEYLNLSAQLREINQNFPNSFYELEATWRDLLPDGPGPHPDIEVNIYKDFEPGNPVPLEYLVKYRVDGGRWVKELFDNV